MKHINVALFVVHKGCPHMCSFCNQRSISGSHKDLTPDDVHSAVKIAVQSLSENQAAGGEIAFFGGSFTMVEREYMLSLLEAAYEYVGKGIFKGIRISTRPDGIDGEICGILKKYGVTAVELGAQSLDDRVLMLNERGHTAEQVENACKILKEYGFEVGLQMMTGLYGSKDSDSLETAEKIIDLAPATVRIYPTVVLKGTRLYELMKNGEFIPKGVDETVDLCARLIEMFENAGIKVIRVGLHSGGGVEEGFAGGAYHPALRELCEGRLYYNRASLLLKKYDGGRYILCVNPKEISKMTGQKKENLIRLREKGFECTVKGIEGLSKYEVEIHKG
ncbi:MAG: radical SAM protein [Acutalibacteraceae bacterium]|nr:radical SAM protein [Acutalibacteraceae bacterium]